MRKNYYILAVLSAFSLMAISCVQENLEPIKVAVPGNEIIFGARAGFESSSSDTKTVYSGIVYEDANKVKFERVWWDVDDKVHISYPQSGKAVHYIVGTPENSSSTSNGVITDSYATLSKYMTDEGLRWTDDESHTFYALYPSAYMIDPDDPNTTLAKGVNINGTVVDGIIPVSQEPASVKFDQATNTWVAAPNMDYAYMVAKETVEGPNEDGGVSLTFYPVVTAVEVTMVALETVTIGEIVVSSTTPITGSFRTDLENWSPASRSYPACEPTTVVAPGYEVSVSLWQNGQPITVQSGQSLKFTVFLMPGTPTDQGTNGPIENLTLGLSTTGASTVFKTLGDVEGYDFPGFPSYKKTRISNLHLPVAEDLDLPADSWMEQLPDNMVMKNLSIPGTTHSFSFGYNQSNARYYKTQTLTFAQQWNAGIRAFEIACDRPSNTNSGANATSLGSQNVRVNRQNMGYTVRQVIDEVHNLVSGTKECAVIILTYQSEGATFSRYRNNRCAQAFAESLLVLYNELIEAGYNADPNKPDLVLYTPSITLDDVRGSIMLICRINQKDEPEPEYSYRNQSQPTNTLAYAATNYANAETILAGTPILLVDGCGTAKDRWGARGYYVTQTYTSNGQSVTSENKAPDMANAYTNTTHSNELAYSKTVEYCITVNNPISTYRKGTADFTFGTNQSYDIWYQDWSRVIANPLSFSWSQYGESGTTSWFVSQSEKLNDAITTFQRSISGAFTASNYVVINSLSGYLVEDDSFEDSLIPSLGRAYGGSGGDIKALADYMNEEFYKVVLDSRIEETTGPTGIVMMDYVTNQLTYDDNNNPTNQGSYYLPGIIIGNNKKYTVPGNPLNPTPPAGGDAGI